MSPLFISDLDGTLLDPHASLTARSRYGLCALLDDGVAFTVASARSRASIVDILEGVPLTLPIIEFNGAYLTDMATGEHLLVRSIEEALVAEIVGCTTARGLFAALSGTRPEGDVLFLPPASNDGIEWYLGDRRRRKDPRLRLVADTADHVGDAQMVCVNIVDREEPLVELLAELQERVGDQVHLRLFENEYTRGWYWLTIHALDATKDNGVRSLVEHAGLQGRDVVVFGDNDNDLPLFDVSDHAVAVDNAIPSVRERADEVIGPHHEDSVVAYLLERHGVSPGPASASGASPADAP